MKLTILLSSALAVLSAVPSALSVEVSLVVSIHCLLYTCCMIYIVLLCVSFAHMTSTPFPGNNSYLVGTKQLLIQ